MLIFFSLTQQPPTQDSSFLPLTPVGALIRFSLPFLSFSLYPPFLLSIFFLFSQIFLIRFDQEVDFDSVLKKTTIKINKNKREKKGERGRWEGEGEEEMERVGEEELERCLGGERYGGLERFVGTEVFCLIFLIFTFLFIDFFFY